MRTSLREKIVSFIAGYGRTEPKIQTIENGIYIATRLTALRIELEFESREPRGVNCTEIRKQMMFHKVELEKTKPVDRRIYLLARLLCRFGDEQLGWMASYIHSRQTHLWPHEARAAKNGLWQVKRLLELDASAEATILLA
jgi:hypothetical protein